MVELFKEDPNAFTVAKIWITFVLLSLGCFLLFIEKTYYSFDAFGIWILSCIALFYLARQKIVYLEKKQKIIVIAIGFCICILSFATIPLGISKPPYSIGEYSILLSGIGVILFGLLKMRSLVLPVLIPSIAIMGYNGYLLFLNYIDALTAPLIPFTTMLSTTILNTIGIQTITNGNIISFLSLSGEQINLTIIGECTGIISLGTFTVATIIVLTTFPKSINRRSLGLIVLGYFGTYCANITRIVLIALSGYFFGPSGVIEHVHIHIGWILFSLWMIIFWYYYFTRQIGITFFKKGNNQDSDNNR